MEAGFQPRFSSHCRSHELTMPIDLISTPKFRSLETTFERSLMTNAKSARRALRDILQGRTCVHPASVFDPVSARLAEDAGFEVGMLAGSVASMTVLGAPDAILLTLSEFTAQARRICRATALPLLCDADHGYGNALNVMRTVEELENAGVAGLSIEDTVLPAPFGSHRTSQLISVEEGAAKINAALEARQDETLVIAGRTSAAMITGIDDAAVRLKTYEDAGADALFAIGLKTWNELDAIADATSLPLILGGIGSDLMDRKRLAARNVRVALQGHQPFAAAVRALQDTYTALRAGVAPVDLAGVASADLMKRVKRDGQHRERVAHYLETD